ncbi:hypothetical protein DSO57_1027052 [Entomophthora muscae]|uniref:Uncharacterized protein n=1 Tax=Entomophthora muscae TaxID=34485 RepID=A0ACC2ULX6_9FUNG|nr:hypothetical protein DSO57_1027052 [Entomophthora muscae]
MEQSFCQYIPHMVQKVLNYKELDSNWISVVNNHVQGAKEVTSSLINQIEQINLAISSKPSNQVAAAEDAKMLHKDVLKIFDHYQNIEKEIKEIHLDNTLLYKDLETLQSQLEGSRYSCKGELEIREELKETRTSLYSMQDQMYLLLSCLSTPVPQSALEMTLHSYDNKEDAQRQVPRHIMMMEAVLESSDNPMVTPEQTRLQKHLASSEARFRDSISCQLPTNRPS